MERTEQTQINTAPAGGSRDQRSELDAAAASIWAHVSHSPVHNLWDLQGVDAKVVGKRVFNSFIDDNLVSRAAELGYYFLFALFPTLIFASSIMGLVARQASEAYSAMLEYLSIVIPPSAYHMVIDTFNQTTRAATGGKIAFGLAAALWSASVGFGAIQDTANIVYKVKETRPYWKAKLEAIGVTLILSALTMVTLGVLLGTDYLAKRAHLMHVANALIMGEVILIKAVSFLIVLMLLMLLFAVIYYFAPDVKNACWRWFSPGSAVGIASWVLASLGLRAYLHYFNSFTATYGSLGAVIILLTWFYVTGLTLLLGAEVNSEIESAVAEKKLKDAGKLPASATAEPGTPAAA